MSAQEYVRGVFFAAAQQRGCENRQLIENGWRHVWEAYSAPDRKYHNFEHIMYMLKKLAQSGIAENAITQLAIIYHDIVYDAQAGFNNEGMSAAKVVRAGTLFGFADWETDAMAECVLATDHMRNREARKLDHVARLVADLDLLGFSEPWESVVKNMSNVRAEYAHVSDDDFIVGHSAVLAYFLKRPSIYASGYYFCTSREQVARTNIERLIRELTPLVTSI